jgi:hypothetical protein
VRLARIAVALAAACRLPLLHPRQDAGSRRQARRGARLRELKEIDARDVEMLRSERLAP